MKRLPEFCRVTSRFRAKRVAGTEWITLGSSCAGAAAVFFSGAGRPVLPLSFILGMDRGYAYDGVPQSRRIVARLVLCRIVPQGIRMIMVAPRP